MKRNRKQKEYEVLVEFQPATYVHVMAESESEAVDKVDKLIDERRLDFDADSVRDSLLENVVSVTCGDESVTGQRETVAPDRRDPFRHSITTKAGAVEGFVLDENACEFAESIVNYPTDSSWVHAVKRTEGRTERCVIEGQFCNDAGHLEHVDDCLERFTMRHWREIADRITRLMLVNAGLGEEDIDAVDWPVPVIAVTKTADPRNDDCIDCVRFEWETTAEIFRHITNGLGDRVEEETCTYCDHVIKYRFRPGVRTVVCPECGKVNALCNLCNGPDHDKCRGCEVSEACAKVNEHMAKGAE